VHLYFHFQNEAAVGNEGTACAFACIQAACDWLSSGAWQEALQQQSKGTISTATCVGPDESTKSSSVNPTSSVSSTIHGGASASSASSGSRETLIEELNRQGYGTGKKFKEKFMSADFIGTVAGSDAGSSVPGGAISDEEDRKESELVKLATAEACRIAAAYAAKNKSILDVHKGVEVSASAAGQASMDADGIAIEDINLNDDDDIDDDVNEPADEKEPTSSTVDGASVFDVEAAGASLESDSLGISILTSSARGLWRYTVGLVGKPSAGNKGMAIC
jgi:hypothetical protein